MMVEVLFPDKAHPPTDADVTAALGPAKRHWDSLVAHIEKTYPDAAFEWKHYGAKYGWTLVVHGKKRNLLYLRPQKKGFPVSLALSEKGVAAAAEADLPDPILQLVRDAPKYPEGHAVRLEVTSARDVSAIKKLLALQAAT
jgi:hypothetical protein